MFTSKIPQIEPTADWRQAVPAPRPGGAERPAAAPLQSTLGNQMTLRLLAERRDLRLTQPGDATERDADEMADAALAGRPPRRAGLTRPAIARSAAAAARPRGGGVDGLPPG